MRDLLNFMTKVAFIWFFGALGDTLLIVGIIMAATETTIAGFTPVVWILMAIASYLGMIWVVTMRILARMGS